MSLQYWDMVSDLNRRREAREAFITMAWALPLAAGIIGLRQLKFITICGLRNDRVGHLVADGTEQVVRYRKRQPNETRLYFFEYSVSCNQQFEKMLRRSLPVKSRALRHIANWLQRLPGGSMHIVPSSYTRSRDTEGLYRDGNAAIPFAPDEDAVALEWLKSKGWTEGEPFICLLIRDSAFTMHDPVANYGLEADASAWAYHSYRNSEVATYVSAIEWLNAQGVWVLRMGRIMEREAPHSHQRFIDYAFDPTQNDLLDIWLFAHASAVISTGTGLDVLATIYRRPLLMINFPNVSQIWSWCHCISYPKKLRNALSGRPLTLTEQLKARYFTVEDFQSRQIEWVDLTSSEILNACIRFWGYLEGSLRYDRRSQEEFWAEMARVGNQLDHGFRHPQALIEPMWMATIHA